MKGDDPFRTPTGRLSPPYPLTANLLSTWEARCRVDDFVWHAESHLCVFMNVPWSTLPSEIYGPGKFQPQPLPSGMTDTPSKLPQTITTRRCRHDRDLIEGVPQDAMPPLAATNSPRHGNREPRGVFLPPPPVSGCHLPPTSCSWFDHLPSEIHAADDFHPQSHLSATSDIPRIKIFVAHYHPPCRHVLEGDAVDEEASSSRGTFSFCKYYSFGILTLIFGVDTLWSGGFPLERGFPLHVSYFVSTRGRGRTTLGGGNPCRMLLQPAQFLHLITIYDPFQFHINTINVIRKVSP